MSRLRTSDDEVALTVAANGTGVRGSRVADGWLSVQASEPALDANLLALAARGDVIRRLEPATPPLEAAFLRLTA